MQDYADAKTEVIEAILQRAVKMPEMRYRQLGDSELQVSEISLGSWLTYSGGVGREQTQACTRAAFDAGINFFDTANVYGRGAAEEVGARSSPTTTGTATSWRRGLLPDVGRRPGPLGRSRSTSRSTRR